MAAAGDVPLLVTETYGAGRTMAFAGDSTWLWWMHGYENLHKCFWRQMVLWLAHKDQTAEGNVWIKFPQRRLSPNQRADFSIGAQSPTGETLSGLDGEAEVVLPDGTRCPVARRGKTTCWWAPSATRRCRATTASRRPYGTKTRPWGRPGKVFGQSTGPGARQRLGRRGPVDQPGSDDRGRGGPHPNG